MNKKWITIGALSILVLGGGYWAYKYFTVKPAVATTIKGQVKLGDVRKTITATGTVSFLNPIPLSFQVGGKLIALNVKAGDEVKQGQVLAQLDTTNLKSAVTKAQIDLLQAQASLQKTRDNFTDLTMAQAKSQLAKTQVNLVTVQQNTDPDYLANQVYLASQNVLIASNALAKAQQSGNTSDIQAKQGALSQAESSLKTAQNLQNGGAAQSLLAAQIEVDVAQNAVALQAQGPKSVDLIVAQSNIDQARASLEIANKNLADASIIAPIDGIMTTVTAQNYQNVDTKTIMTMAAGQNSLQIDTSVDQADITQLKVGQKADITLDTVPNQHISGTVSQIAPLGTTSQNVTTFNVTILLDSPSPLLHASMNANVSIIINEAKNVLTVPSEAVSGSGERKMVMVPGAATANSGTGNQQNSNPSSTQGGTAPQGQRQGGTAAQGQGGTAAQGQRQGGTAAQGQRQAGQFAGNTAGAMAGLNMHPVFVVTGLDDGTNVEIKSGLTEGQEIIVGTRSASTTNTSTTQGNPMGALRGVSGGGGGGGGGVRPGN